VVGRRSVRREFDTPYGLATKRIATDGIDIFVQDADDDLARAGDNQLPIRHDARTGRSHLPDHAWAAQEDCHCVGSWGMDPAGDHTRRT
jgi:hypothetical protein